MTRISSLLVASALAILPIGAFAQTTGQTTGAPAKTTEPTAMTTAAPVTTAPVTGKAATSATTVKPEAKATTAATAKPDVKTPAAGAKSEVHGMNTGATHSRTVAPAKS